MPRQHKLVFDSIRRSPESWIQPATFDVVSAFVTGYDAACEYGMLAGFREWLILRAKSELTNLVWREYVLGLAFPKFSQPREALTSEEAHRHAIDTMFALIDEFDEARGQFESLNNIIRAYDKWVQELDARDRLIDQAWAAVVEKYPNRGLAEEDHWSSVHARDERLTIEFFKETSETDSTPFVVVTMERGVITSITERPGG